MSHRRVAHLLVLTSLAVGTPACSSGPRATVRAEVDQRDLPGALEAYERVRAMDGADPALLRDVAALVLQQAVEGEDLAVRDAALSQLRRARERAHRTLRRLADSPDEAVRAAALELQAAAGDTLAVAQLRASLDSTDQAARASAQSALDPQHAGDLAHLRGSLTDPSARVRRAAALRLRLAAEDDDTRVDLELVTRVDPALTVRVTALSALARQGEPAFAPLRERLHDPEPSVRMAALLALAVCDATRAAGIYQGFLATPPSSDSVEAARLLATRVPAGAAGTDPSSEDALARTRATEYLLAALTAPDESLRAQTAVALSSLPALYVAGSDDDTPRLQRALAAQLERETVRQTRLVLAQTLLRASDDTVGRAALGDLLTGDDVPAVMAAAALARLGDEAALTRLDAALQDPRATHRRIAAAALTWDAGDPDRARAALEDEDAFVRVAAAGGVLSAR
ncbi:MAG: hypothetical protein R3B40_02300 [Polyangiales bacterium]|nr:hypothetical protein [Myxococcales bacterium]MCB9657097.1 hypothetical protein [Sandaracinaceae bacterium]